MAKEIDISVGIARLPWNFVSNPTSREAEEIPEKCSDCGSPLKPSVDIGSLNTGSMVCTSCRKKHGTLYRFDKFKAPWK